MSDLVQMLSDKNFLVLTMPDRLFEFSFFSTFKLL